MRYVEARIEDFKREETYRILVTENLRLVPQNKILNKKYIDCFKPQKIDQRSGDQIVEDVMKKAGLFFGNKEK